MKNKEWTPVPFEVLEQNTFWSPFSEASHRNGESFKVLEFTGVVSGSVYGYTFSIEFCDGTRYSADIAELNGDYRNGRSGYDGNEVLPPESHDPTYQQSAATDEMAVAVHKNAEGKVSRVVMENKNTGVLLASCDFTLGDVYYVASPLAAPTAQGICRNAMTARYYESTVYSSMAVAAYAPQAWLYTLETTHRQTCIVFGTEVLRNCKALVVCGPMLSAGMKMEIAEAIRLGIQIIYLHPQFGVNTLTIGGEWSSENDSNDRYLSIPIFPNFDLDAQLGTNVLEENDNILEMYCLYHFDAGKVELCGYTDSEESVSGITEMDFCLSVTCQQELIEKIKSSCEVLYGKTFIDYIETVYDEVPTPSDIFWQQCENCGCLFKVQYTPTGIKYLDGENVCDCKGECYHPVNGLPSYSQRLESQNTQPLEERIFGAIDSALEAAGFQVLDGDRDSVIVKDLSDGREYEIYYKEIYPDDSEDMGSFEPENITANQSSTITGQGTTLSYDDFITKCRMMDEACRQWCAFIDEAPNRRDGILFTEFYADICKQKYAEYLDDPAYREDCNNYASYSDEERYNMAMKLALKTSQSCNQNIISLNCVYGRESNTTPRFSLDSYVRKPIDANSEQGRESLFMQILDYTSHVYEFKSEDFAFLEKHGFKPETFTEFLER